mgnify:CR=1 FL=1
MKNFQIIFIFIFIVAAIFGMLVFSGAIPLGGDDQEGGQGTVILWGTFRADALNTVLEEFNTANPSIIVKYVQKNPLTFDQDLLEALASSTGPDLFFLPADLAFHYRNKILAVPYQNYSVTSFQNTFVGGGEVFLNSKGIMAFPMMIDPLVMYYNRSTLDANSIAYPPKTWEEFVSMVPILTKRDDANKIIKSSVAMGHFSNVFHAKDILSTLFMQAGNRIVKEQAGVFAPDLGAVSAGPYSADKILEFYTSFADPQKSVYSWNKSFPLSRDYFSTDNLAFYFGYASELQGLINKNPNQNFLVAEMPQIKGSNFKLTYAKVTGLAISAFSKNADTAFYVADQMSRGDFLEKLSKSLGVVPARRDLLQGKTDDPYYPTFYTSAFYARSWLDPSDGDTDVIFSRMIDGVLSNSFSTSDAIVDARNKMSLLLNK